MKLREKKRFFASKKRLFRVKSYGGETGNVL